jgi:hypothetical protein
MVASNEKNIRILEKLPEMRGDNTNRHHKCLTRHESLESSQGILSKFQLLCEETLD